MPQPTCIPHISDVTANLDLGNVTVPTDLSGLSTMLKQLTDGINNSYADLVKQINQNQGVLTDRLQNAYQYLFNPENVAFNNISTNNINNAGDIVTKTINNSSPGFNLRFLTTAETGGAVEVGAPNGDSTQTLSALFPGEAWLLIPGIKYLGIAYGLQPTALLTSAGYADVNSVDNSGNILADGTVSHLAKGTSLANDDQDYVNTIINYNTATTFHVWRLNAAQTRMAMWVRFVIT